MCRIVAGFCNETVRLAWDAKNISLYRHEPVTITLYLWCEDDNLLGWEESKPSKLDKGEFSYISHAKIFNNPEIREENGKKWRIYPIDSFVITLDKEGKNKLSGGEYSIDIAVPEVIRDKFQRERQVYRRQRMSVPVEPLFFSVKALPKNDDGKSFSGAIGNYSITVDIPPGDIYVDEEAIAIINVRGEGWINEQILPEYRGAFGKGTKLKSINEYRNKYLENGKLVSEIQLECIFIPTSLTESIIGEVSMEFFNPKNHKYTQVKSTPVPVKVSSVAVKTPIHEI